jgi:opacity protein-like surface antigen
MCLSAAQAADAIIAEPPEVLTVAERALVFEADLWGGYLWRGGSAINLDGFESEDEEFPLMGGGLLAGIPLGDAGLLQLELDGEGTFYDDDLDDRAYEGSITGGGHLAWTSGAYLIGAFGGGGRTYVTLEDGDHYFGGLEGKVNFANAALALQGGYIGSNSEEEEFFDETWFIRGIGQIFFNDGRTMLQGELAYGNGTQDLDDGDGDDLDIYAWGLELEHAPDWNIGAGALSMFAAYEGVHLVEDSSASRDDKITDHTVRVGLKLRFGAATPRDREMATAPDLPNVGRWLGATPAVD